MEDGPASGPERYREFVARCEAAAEAESAEARARRWRDVSFEERARVGIGLMALAEIALRSRPVPYEKPPLPNPFGAVRERQLMADAAPRVVLAEEADRSPDA